MALIQGRATAIVDFCRGFSAGSLHVPVPANSPPAFADGHAHGRLACRGALAEYLRDRGMSDLKDQSIVFFLLEAEQAQKQAEH
jgi:hypothetical protein